MPGRALSRPSSSRWPLLLLLAGVLVAAGQPVAHAVAPAVARGPADGQGFAAGEGCLTSTGPRPGVGTVPTPDGGCVKPQVVGGSEVPDGRYPFQAALTVEHGDQPDDFRCGGTVLNRYWVLTAAHCVPSQIGVPNGYHVIVGRTDLTDQAKGQRRMFVEVHQYPDYGKDPVTGNPQPLARDWALIGLQEALSLDLPATPASDTVKAVRLVASGDHSHEQDGTPATVIGWGMTEHSPISVRLREAQIPISSDQRCRALAPDDIKQYLIDEVMTCAGAATVDGHPAPGRDSCYGDSGGPLLVQDAQGQMVQVALVSWGMSVTCGEYPGVYASLQDPALQQWIAQHTQRLPVGATTTRIGMFEHSNGDAANGNRLKQTVVSHDGAWLHTRFRDPKTGTWGAWATVAVGELGLPDGQVTIRSFSQATTPEGQPKQDVLSGDGKTLYSRVFVGGWRSWESRAVGQLGLPEGGPVLAFEQASPDAAIGQAWKQTVLSDDGGRLFTRFFRGGSWGTSWSTVPVASIGIGAFPEVFVPGLTAIRSFSQGVNPAGQPKQEFLSPDGTQLHTRVFTNGAWGTWQTPLRVPDLGLPLLPPSSG